jgi:hypothetical protein
VAPDHLLDTVPDPGPGWGRLAITTDVDATVEKIADGRPPRIVCKATPCVLTLPYGELELRFRGKRDRDRTSSATATVNEPTAILNHRLGQERNHAGFGLGSLILGAGVATMLLGGSVMVDGTGADVTAPQTRTGEAMMIGGLGAALVGGIIMAVSPRSVYQPGSSRAWAQARPPTEL